MKTENTKKLEQLLAATFDSRKDFYVFECTIGWFGNQIVDCIKYTTGREVVCYEIKQSKADFHSKNKLTFIGNRNYFVMPLELYEKVKDEIPPEIGVYASVDGYNEKRERGPYGTTTWLEWLNGYRQLHCVKRAKRIDLKADREVILSSMHHIQRRRQDSRRLALLHTGQDGAKNRVHSRSR